jgi:hypothetical protein
MFRACHLEAFKSGQEMIAETQARRRKHEQRFGQVREIVHINFKGYKFVGVGDRLVYAPESKMRTFADFLLKYMATTMGSEWWKHGLQVTPPEERHPILQWRAALSRNQKAGVRGADGLVATKPDALTMAYLQLAYDLYILRHHGALQRKLVERLKRHDSFQGARYELFATAVCIRAGCTIEHEDDKDGSRTHPEFVATHTETGSRLALEAKSRRRPGVLGFPGTRDQSAKPQANVRRLLSQAVRKEVTTPLVVFLDLNLPLATDGNDAYWGREILETVDAVCPRPDPDQFNLLVVTNYPAHYCEPGDPMPELRSLNVLSELPAKTHNGAALVEISKQVARWGSIPAEFPTTR